MCSQGQASFAPSEHNFIEVYKFAQTSLLANRNWKLQLVTHPPLRLLLNPFPVFSPRCTINRDTIQWSCSILVILNQLCIQIYKLMYFYKESSLCRSGGSNISIEMINSNFCAFTIICMQKAILADSTETSLFTNFVENSVSMIWASWCWAGHTRRTGHIQCCVEYFSSSTVYDALSSSDGDNSVPSRLPRVASHLLGLYKRLSAQLLWILEAVACIWT